MTAGGVPPWARPVLEALVELAYAPLDNEQTAAAWNRIGEACEAALVSDAGTRMGPMTGKPMPCPNCGAIRHERDAHFCAASDAGTGLYSIADDCAGCHGGGFWSGACEKCGYPNVPLPEGEPFFHKLGCPKINGTAAHCTCPPDRETPEQTPAANAPETSTSLVGTAPDAELDRLLIEYARCQVQARYASRSQPELNRLAYAVEDAAAAIHAHVERVKREARDNARAAAYAEITVRRDNERRAKEAPDAHP